MNHALPGLLPNTKAVFEKLAILSNLQSYTLIGGTALAIHLQHRLSEDLDLFTWREWQSQDKDFILTLNQADDFQQFEVLHNSANSNNTLLILKM